MTPDLQFVLAWLHARVEARADLHLDSRAIRAGDVYCALPGAKSNGSTFIDDAIRAGAAAVLCEADDALPDHGSVPILAVRGLRAGLGALGDDWYGRPSAALTVVAITGTNGKTTTSQWIAQALTRVGRACGAIGTLGVRWPDGSQSPATLTTPDVLSMHRLLAQMRDAGAELVALEASSIGVVQGRLDGVRIALAGFTNLSRDHLDFHADMASYEAAKARLFAWPDLRAAIVNIDDAAGQRLHAALPSALTYAIDRAGQATVGGRDLLAIPQGQAFTLVLPAGEAQIVTRLLGVHNVYNLLLVAGVLHQLGWSLPHIGQALSALEPVDGRLQAVEPIMDSASTQVASTSNTPQRAPLVVVDYAHTPDALARALQALRPVAQARAGRLICVFGCGGDRDPGKRPEMGRIAGELADHVVVTSDNPRSESADKIIEQIVAGVPATVVPDVQSDRALAILSAIWAVDPADVVLLAGKGHETYQEIGGQRLPFDDREWARLAMLLPNVSAVSTDTRRIAAGELFVALSGPNFDGHAYLAQARDVGAAAALVDHRVDIDLPQISLGATGAALMRIGTAWRRRFDLPVIGVAGSNGKTTTKEMVSAVLALWLGTEQRLATAGNLNNEIGVPLTLLRLQATHRAAVIELGMNHPGEIAVLTAMAAPTVALVTNAQREHQEFMQSVEAVARENGEVFTLLGKHGTAVFPRDDEHAAIWDEMSAGAARLTFGLTDACDVRAVDVDADEHGTTCVVVSPEGRATLRLAVPGRHNLRNALGAIAACLAAGVALEVCVDALAGFQAVSGRMQSRRLDDGTLLIDDTYNANPDSVRAAVDVLARLPSPRALVLGDMGEVGDNGPEMHREVGAYAQEQGIDILLTLGQASTVAAQAFGSQARSCDSVEDVVAALRDAKPASVLVKGSRFMRMERVVNGFSGGQHAA